MTPFSEPLADLDAVTGFLVDAVTREGEETYFWGIHCGDSFDTVIETLGPPKHSSLDGPSQQSVEYHCDVGGASVAYPALARVSALFLTYQPGPITNLRVTLTYPAYGAWHQPHYDFILATMAKLEEKLGKPDKRSRARGKQLLLYGETEKKVCNAFVFARTRDDVRMTVSKKISR